MNLVHGLHFKTLDFHQWLKVKRCKRTRKINYSDGSYLHNHNPWFCFKTHVYTLSVTQVILQLFQHVHEQSFLRESSLLWWMAKFLAFRGPRMCFTPNASHPKQFSSPLQNNLISILTSCSNLRLRLPRGLSLSNQFFWPKLFMHLWSSPCTSVFLIK